MKSGGMDLESVWRLLQNAGANACIKQWRKPPVPSKILRELYETYWQEPATKDFLLNYPFMPSDLLDTLLDEANLDTASILLLVGHPRLSQEVFAKLVVHPEASVRAACAAQKRLAPRLLQKLADDENPAVRAAVAASPGIKLQWQAVLSQDPDPWVRQCLAGNAVLEPDVALLLSTDSVACVRATVALQATVEDTVLAAWLAGADGVLAMTLFERKELPANLAGAAAVSPLAPVRSEAFARWPQNHALQAAVALQGSEPERIQLSELPELPPEVIRFLLSDPCDAVVEKLIERPSLPESTIIDLFESRPKLRSRLVLHPNVSSETLARWCAHATPELRSFLLYRPDLPDAVLEDWVNRKGYLEVLGHLGMGGAELPDLDPDIANQLACHVLPSVRRMAATAHKISPAMLRRLAADPAPEVRLAAASHAFMPSLELDELTRDEDEHVAETARKAWKARQTQRNNTPLPAENLPSVRGLALRENVQLNRTQASPKSFLNKLRSFIADQN